MDPVCLAAFEDEMTKIAGFREFVRRISDFFRPQDERTKRRVDYFFSPKVGKEKWDYMPRYAREQSFVDGIVSSPLADDQLKAHVKSMHDLSRAKPVGRIPSGTEPGKTYEIRKLPDGSLGCLCGDWRYVGTVTPGYECKHIQAYKGGESRATG
jgi:hypothetical protein